MNRKIGKLVLAITLGVIGCGAATEVGAQVFTPTYMAPRLSSDNGIYLSNYPGDFTVEGIFRRRSGAMDFGIRLGLADTRDLSVLVGGELRNPIVTGAPVDLAFTGSAQGVFGGATGAGFLAGLSVGHTFATPEFAITPYLHPRIGAVQPLRGDDFELDLLADLGLDFRVSPNLEFRIGVGLGTGPGLGIGLAWR
jgi:hypothetical protein